MSNFRRRLMSLRKNQPEPTPKWVNVVPPYDMDVTNNAFHIVSMDYMQDHWYQLDMDLTVDVESIDDTITSFYIAIQDNQLFSYDKLADIPRSVGTHNIGHITLVTNARMNPTSQRCAIIINPRSSGTGTISITYHYRNVQVTDVTELKVQVATRHYRWGYFSGISYQSETPYGIPSGTPIMVYISSSTQKYFTWSGGQMKLTNNYGLYSHYVSTDNGNTWTMIKNDVGGTTLNLQIDSSKEYHYLMGNIVTNQEPDISILL